MKRRDFIHGVIRGGLFGALAVMTGMLVSRGQVRPAASCDLNYRCRSCSRFERCALPEAETARKDG